MMIGDVTCARPGTLSMISARSANSGVTLTLAEITASSLAISAARFLQDTRISFPGRFWCRMLVLSLQADFEIDQGDARFRQRRKFLTRGIRDLARRLAE